MNFLKTQTGIVGVIFVLLLINSKETFGDSSYDGMYECFSYQICNCSLIADYTQCWEKTPKELRAIAAEKVPEQYSFADFTEKLTDLPKVICPPSDESKDALEGLYTQIKEYESKVSMSILEQDKNAQIQSAKICAMGLVARCAEFENECF